MTAAAFTEARKGKKKATKRTPAASTGDKKPVDGESNTPSDQELEERLKKAPASTEVPVTSVQLPASSFPEATSTRQGFHLTSFMASFDPGHATVTDNADTPESRLEGEAGEVTATTPRGPEPNNLGPPLIMSDREVRLLVRKASTGDFSASQLKQLMNSAASLRTIQRVLACVDFLQYPKMDTTLELTAKHKLARREYAKEWLIMVASRGVFG
ncbi:hypothetical protein PInf_026693 [Phytophthora infestans]|nr:hypothetical protein PInf_026693 [Phytophthora infestans]